MGGLTASQYTFSEMTSLTLQFATAQMDGILGMGYQNISVNNLTPLVVALKNNNEIQNNVVTFNLNHSNKDSTLTIGGYDDSEKSGDFNYHNVVEQG